MHLRAEMPAAKIASRGLMELRIARKVAALSGLAGPPDNSDDAGRGRAWLADYGLLSVTELTLGGPLVDPAPPVGIEQDAGVFVRDGRRFRHVDGAGIDVMPIPNVALRDYGPNTQAALVLTGVNKVLEPVSRAVIEAMADIRVQVDSPHLLVAVAQCMLQEVFAAQPILLLHGLQAARIQRTLVWPDVTRSASRLSRVEYGWPRPEWAHQPMHVALIRELWESLSVGGEVYDAQGRLRLPEDEEPYLRASPLVGFEQNESVAVNGRSAAPERLASRLRYQSEASLLGLQQGVPHCTISVVDREGGPPEVEVIVPRQRQIEVILAILGHSVGPLRPSRPALEGHALALPVIDVAKWSEKDLLHRRAALLAHHYSLRVAGWIAGMTAPDRRRSRDECAERCEDLLRAAEKLLDEDDPLRDQVAAYALGYRQQYDSSFGRGGQSYPLLARIIDRMTDRVRREGRGKVEYLEVLPVVLHDLSSACYDTALGIRSTPSVATLTSDLDRWWEIVRELRRELLPDPEERTYLDHDHAAFLLNPGSDDQRILTGLDRMADVLRSRERAAARDGRSLSVRTSNAVYLRGLAMALERRIDTSRLGAWAKQAVEIAEKLEEHEETRAFLDQRAGQRTDGARSYDGTALLLLATLADGWVAAVRSGALSDGSHDHAVDRAELAVKRMCDYLHSLRPDPRHPAPPGRPTSRVDDARAEVVRLVTRRWAEWVEARR